MEIMKFMLKTPNDYIFTMDLNEEWKFYPLPTFPTLSHGLYVSKNLNLYKRLILDSLFKNGFVNISSEEKLVNNTFQIIDNDKQVILIRWKFKSKITALQNFIAMYPFLKLITPMREFNCSEERAILETIKIGEKLGINSITMATSIRKIYMFKFHGAKEILGKRRNTKELSQEDYDKIYKTQKAGLFFVNKNYQRQVVKNLDYFDRNSAYPYVALNYPLPCEAPIHINYNDLAKNGMYGISTIYLTAKIKENHISILWDIQKKKFINECKSQVFQLWDFEIEYIKKNYDIKEFTILDTLAFKKRYGLLNDLIKEFEKIKENTHSPTIRSIVKFASNTFLGSFATKKIRNQRIYKNDFTFEVKTTSSDKYYPAIFSYIVSQNNVNLANTLNIIGTNNILYVDTDGFFCFHNKILKDILPVSPNKYGYFKYERVSEFAFKNPRVYGYITNNGEIINKIAGYKTDSPFLPIDFTKEMKVKTYVWDFDNLYPIRIEKNLTY